MATQQNTAIVIGATGLVGQHLVQALLDSGHYQVVYQVVRQAKQSIDSAVLKTVVVSDFATLETALQGIDLQGADAFSTLGTTIKQAGSRQRFRQVDWAFNVSFARVTKQLGAVHFLLLSALGADANSRIFYNQVKGETEQAIEQINFAHLSVFQPSLLIGKHQDSRLMEGVAQQLFALGKSIVPQTWRYRPIEAERVAQAMRLAALSRSTHEKTIYMNDDMLTLTLEKNG